MHTEEKNSLIFTSSTGENATLLQLITCFKNISSVTLDYLSAGGQPKEITINDHRIMMYLSGNKESIKIRFCSKEQYDNFSDFNKVYSKKYTQILTYPYEINFPANNLKNVDWK